MKTREFFDRQHQGELAPVPLYYRLLKRFEVTRVDTADQLLSSGRSLLDIGCGEGELVRRVADRFKEIHATDISESVIRAAKRCSWPPHIHFETLDANGRLPFEEGRFDSIVALSTLQYLFDPEEFLAEAHRILPPNGHLLLETPNMAYLPQRLRLLSGVPIRTSFWVKGIDGGNLHYFTADLLKQLLRSAGFVPEVITGSGVFAPLRTWRVSLLCGNIFVRARRA